ncbi:Signal recognition particle core component [Entomortierella chlamydospora]|nr:Signal recognition particle core component [Entomortierella chlamydospora]
MAQVQQLFGDLERHVKREEHDKVLAISDKILKLNPKDKDALHCKAITLIRLERYADALSILNRQLEGKFVFESAYCLYRTNQLAEGARLIENRRQELQSSGNGTLSWNLRHLEAQMLYRMERYQDCIERYAGMLKDTPKTDDSYNDILTNFNACKAAVLYAGESLDDRWKVEDVAQTTYELSFNSACARIAKGDYTQALTLLDEAKLICRETLNDYDEEEIEQEMAIIVVQTAYVHQLLGHVEQARELYHSVLKIKALEVTVPAVAANNLVAIQKEEDLFDSHKKIKTATTKALGVKFFSTQKRAIAMNELLLNLYQNKFVACRDAARQLLKSQPDNDALYLILAATTQKQKKTAKALEELVEYAAIRPESVAIQFAIVQLQLLDGQDYTAAIESLTRFLKKLPQKEQHRPGYVALLVWLYNQAGQGEKGVDLLSEASAVWAKNSKNATMPSTLLRQTAAFKLRSHRYKDAAKDYEELVRADPSDPAAIAGLIMAYSEFEPALAEKYGASLPEMRNVMALDVDSLEKVVPGLKREYVSTKSGAAAGVTGSRRRPGLRPRRSGARKPNKRKPLLPKNLDPAQKGHPDPERWLPKRDRAAARLTRTRKTGAGSKREMGKGPQGMNMEGGGIGGTGSARIAGREHLTPAPVAAVVEPVKAEEPVDVAAIAKAKSSGSNANKKKKSKGKGKW